MRIPDRYAGRCGVAQVRRARRSYGHAGAAHPFPHSRTPSARQLRELLAVASRPARTFDRAWLRLQEVSHLRTLALIDAELQQGCAAEVRMPARAARPVVREHLRMVRAALRN